MYSDTPAYVMLFCWSCYASIWRNHHADRTRVCSSSCWTPSVFGWSTADSSSCPMVATPTAEECALSRILSRMVDSRAAGLCLSTLRILCSGIGLFLVALSTCLLGLFYLCGSRPFTYKFWGLSLWLVYFSNPILIFIDGYLVWMYYLYPRVCSC